MIENEDRAANDGQLTAANDNGNAEARPRIDAAVLRIVPGPDGTLWTDSTLRGHAARGTGIINNELYVGRLVWNRLRYIKDPATGKRVSRINPREKWITTEVPELRIIDDDLWQAAKARQGRDCGQIRQSHHRYPRIAN